MPPVDGPTELWIDDGAAVFNTKRLSKTCPSIEFALDSADTLQAWIIF
jgi:hypothetical protein